MALGDGGGSGGGCVWAKRENVQCEQRDLIAAEASVIHHPPLNTNTAIIPT